MNLRLTALSALVGISLAAFALPSNACFTVIVGKKVSSTGEILVGHNEDNEMRIITSQYWVDPAVHEDGDFSQVCERSSQWCELRYSQVQTAH